MIFTKWDRLKLTNIEKDLLNLQSALSNTVAGLDKLMQSHAALAIAQSETNSMLEVLEGKLDALTSLLTAQGAQVSGLGDGLVDEIRNSREVIEYTPYRKSKKQCLFCGKEQRAKPRKKKR